MLGRARECRWCCSALRRAQARLHLWPSGCAGPPSRTRRRGSFQAADEAFWPRVVGCLERVGVTAPSRAFPEGHSSVDRQVLLSLAAAFARLPRRVTLVVDGYELVEPGIAKDLDFLLRHSGRRLRTVLTTRVDPMLPLYRYRLEETLVELRIADLGFTDDEADRP